MRPAFVLVAETNDTKESSEFRKAAVVDRIAVSTSRKPIISSLSPGSENISRTILHSQPGGKRSKLLLQICELCRQSADILLHLDGRLESVLLAEISEVYDLADWEESMAFKCRHHKGGTTGFVESLQPPELGLGGSEQHQDVGGKLSTQTNSEATDPIKHSVNGYEYSTFEDYGTDSPQAKLLEIEEEELWNMKIALTLYWDDIGLPVGRDLRIDERQRLVGTGRLQKLQSFVEFKIMLMLLNELSFC
ncbi:hypothetical protein TWF281_007863 [Arthrobotrys megalospora]